MRRQVCTTRIIRASPRLSLTRIKTTLTSAAVMNEEPDYHPALTSSAAVMRNSTAVTSSILSSSLRSNACYVGRGRGAYERAVKRGSPARKPSDGFISEHQLHQVRLHDAYGWEGSGIDGHQSDGKSCQPQTKEGVMGDMGDNPYMSVSREGLASWGRRATAHAKAPPSLDPSFPLIGSPACGRAPNPTSAPRTWGW